MKKIKLEQYIETVTDYHSGGSYETLAKNTKLLKTKDYAVMIRTLNFENNDFYDNLVYCDKKSYDFLSYSHVKENDILMNKIANPGSVYIMPKVNYRVTCGMNLFLILTKNINNRYLYYVMKANEDYIKSKSHGTTTKTITKDEVRNLEFSIHEDPEVQNKIASLLTSIDLYIENNNKIIAEYEKVILSYFNYWFLQFNFLNNENLPYKDYDGEMTYSKKLGMDIPKGWKAINILELVNWIGGAQPSKSEFIYEYKDGYIRFIQNRDYANDENLTYIPIAKSNKTCSSLDIMMDKYGDAGRIRYGIAGAYNVALAKIQVKNEYLREYIRCYLNNKGVYEYLKNACIASTRASLNEDTLSAIYVPIPDDLSVLRRFNDMSSKITQHIIELKNETKRLISLREFILPLLMSGQCVLK